MKLILMVLTALGLLISVISIPVYYENDSDDSEESADILLAIDTETGLKFGDKLNINRPHIVVPTNATPTEEETHLLTRNKKTININDNDKFDLKIIPLNDKVEILNATETTSTEGERTSTIIHDELRAVNPTNATESTNVSIDSIINSNTFTKTNVDLSFLSPILFHVQPDLNANLTINVNRVNDTQLLKNEDFRIAETTTLDDSDITTFVTTDIPNETTVPQELKTTKIPIITTTQSQSTTTSTVAPIKKTQKEINKISLNEKIAEIEAEPVILTQGV